MRYTYDWTSDRIPLWLPHVEHLVGREKINALEIGCFEGRTTVWMLENILTHPTSRIVCVDPFVPNSGLNIGGNELTYQYLDRFVENTLPYRKQVRIIQAYSQEISSDILWRFTNGYDLIYIDASHMPDPTVHEAELAWLVANQGAIIIFDDYGGSLKDAVAEWKKPFVDAGRAEVLHEAYQLIIKAIKP